MNNITINNERKPKVDNNIFNFNSIILFQIQQGTYIWYSDPEVYLLTLGNVHSGLLLYTLENPVSLFQLSVHIYGFSSNYVSWK